MSGPALAEVSIIIPLSADETQHQRLLADLQSHSSLEAEIIQRRGQSRATSLNCGAIQAHRQWLWFLHADSRVSKDNLCALQKVLEQHSEDQHRNSLYYFSLCFNLDLDLDANQSRLSRLLRVNAAGANLRSRLFLCPYGDQGFCISKQLFMQLGGYPENRPYGEDLLFVWRARQAGISLQRIPSTLYTSGRKYHQRGWLHLTLLYQWRWLRLSLPELFTLIVQHWRTL